MFTYPGDSRKDSFGHIKRGSGEQGAKSSHHNICIRNLCLIFNFSPWCHFRGAWYRSSSHEWKRFQVLTYLPRAFAPSFVPFMQFLALQDLRTHTHAHTHPYRACSRHCTLAQRSYAMISFCYFSGANRVSDCFPQVAPCVFNLTFISSSLHFHIFSFSTIFPFSICSHHFFFLSETIFHLFRTRWKITLESVEAVCVSERKSEGARQK